MATKKYKQSKSSSHSKQQEPDELRRRKEHVEQQLLKKKTPLNIKEKRSPKDGKPYYTVKQLRPEMEENQFVVEGLLCPQLLCPLSFNFTGSSYGYVCNDRYRTQ